MLDTSTCSAYLPVLNLEHNFLLDVHLLVSGFLFRLVLDIIELARTTGQVHLVHLDSFGLVDD